MLRLIKGAIVVDLIFGEKSRGRLGAFTANDSWQCPLMFCSIWTQFGSFKKEEEKKRGGCGLWHAASLLVHTSRPVINTPRRGGETETLPRQLACCCCIRRDFCLKHGIKVTRRGRGKSRLQGGGKPNSLIYHLSLFLYWKRWWLFHPSVTLQSSRQRVWGYKRFMPS